MNKSAEAAIQRKWDSDFKIALKVHTPEPPTDELIKKYRICGTVSDAIHAWLRQRGEVLSISSDSTSTSANPEAVTRKNSSITETSSDRQQELKKKKPKSDNSDVESLSSRLSASTISDDSKVGMKKMDTVLEGSTPAIRSKLGSLPGTNYFNEEKGRVVKTVIKHPERKFEAHRNLTRVPRVPRRSQEDDDEALARALQQEEYRNESKSLPPAKRDSNNDPSQENIPVGK